MSEDSKNISPRRESNPGPQVWVGAATARRHVTSNIFINMSRVRRLVLFVAFHLGKKRFENAALKVFFHLLFIQHCNRDCFQKNV